MEVTHNFFYGRTTKVWVPQAPRRFVTTFLSLGNVLKWILKKIIRKLQLNLN